MKKFIYVAALALVASAACTKVETETQQVKVTFQAANYVPQTKAGEVSVFNDFKAFNSRAFLHAEGVDLDASGNVTSSYQEFFGASGETISPYNSGNTIIANPTASSTDVAYWAPSHEYYWPKGSKSFVNFVGWYGTNGTDAITPAVSYTYEGSTWTAKMDWTFSNATVGESGANFLYADMAWRYNENPAAQYKLNGLASDYKGVPMLFHHALAQITVKAYVKNADTYPTINSGVTDGVATWTVKLTDVALTPVNKAGTLALTNADPGSTQTKAWTGTWAGTDTAGDLTVSGEKAVTAVAKTDANDILAATGVVPQTIGADVVLNFNLDITTAYSGSTSHHEILPISVKLNDMGTTAWEMNKKYTYYLQINPSQRTVRFDPAVEKDWEVVETTEKTI
ncbi:MAG: hypothetical protein IJ652_02435 [Bacteroidales bacterium]|nr:hypothetical protein [Bacteroidales bacterium]